MISFQQYVNNKNTDVLCQQIIEHLVLQSLYVQPEETLARFAASHNQHVSFVEAFQGQSGRFGNLLKGIGSGLGALTGTAAAGVGGTLGSAIGGAVGGIKGMFGKSGNSQSDFTVQGGAKAGSQTGRDMMKSGAQGMADAWKNRGNAALVQSYRNSIQALDAYIKTVEKQVPAMSQELMKVKNNLEQISNNIEQALQQGQNPQDIMKFPAPAAAAAPAATA